MICARCDRPIEGEPEPVANMSPSGPGSTVYVHKEWCKPVPRQTGPVRRLHG